ncbi:hypothetical protein [Flavobacterium sp.]|uniref:hypothetical protein n=1 Tax=Flavobacterium sp. TaxID=239 RepID=UPI00374D0C74
MKYLAIIIILIFTSCYNDVKNVHIHGTIKDSLSNKPIENAKVSIVCWNYGKTPDGSYNGKDSLIVTTDKEGHYKSNFEKGTFVEIKVDNIGYKTGFKSDEITDNEVVIDLDLVPLQR